MRLLAMLALLGSLLCRAAAHAEPRLSLLEVEPRCVLAPPQEPPASPQAQDTRDDLERRGADPRLWVDAGKRQTLINMRAALIGLGVWDHVRTIGLARFRLEGHRLVEYAIDPWLGYEIALTTDADLRVPLLRHCCVYPQVVNHHEGRWQLKQLGTGVVLHFIGVKQPWQRYTDVHFDAGGGGLSLRHLEDMLHSTGVTQDEVTEALLADPHARPYLRGISAEYDRRISP